MTDTNGHRPSMRPIDYRHSCGRLLFRGILPPGALVEIRCPRCGKMAVYEFPAAVTPEPIKSESILQSP